MNNSAAHAKFHLPSLVRRYITLVAQKNKEIEPRLLLLNGHLRQRAVPLPFRIEILLEPNDIARRYVDGTFGAIYRRYVWRNNIAVKYFFWEEESYFGVQSLPTKYCDCFACCFCWQTNSWEKVLHKGIPFETLQKFRDEWEYWRKSCGWKAKFQVCFMSLNDFVYRRRNDELRLKKWSIFYASFPKVLTRACVTQGSSHLDGIWIVINKFTMQKHEGSMFCSIIAYLRPVRHYPECEKHSCWLWYSIKYEHFTFGSFRAL